MSFSFDRPVANTQVNSYYLSYFQDCVLAPLLLLCQEVCNSNVPHYRSTFMQIQKLQQTCSDGQINPTGCSQIKRRHILDKLHVKYYFNAESKWPDIGWMLLVTLITKADLINLKKKFTKTDVSLLSIRKKFRSEKQSPYSVLIPHWGSNLSCMEYQ